MRNWLEDRLPDYMVPSYYVFLDALPLLPLSLIHISEPTRPY